MSRKDHTAEEILNEKLGRIRDAKKYAEGERQKWTARIQALDTEEARLLAGLDILEARETVKSVQQKS